MGAGNNLLTVGGDFSNSGTFNAEAGAVILNGGNQAIAGSFDTTFYDLSKTVSSAKTLTFPSAHTTTVSHSTTLKGVGGQLLFLRSDSDGVQYRLNVSNTGTRDIRYVNVKDADNTNAAVIRCDTGCVNASSTIRTGPSPSP